MGSGLAVRRGIPCRVRDAQGPGGVGARGWDRGARGRRGGAQPSASGIGGGSRRDDLGNSVVFASRSKASAFLVSSRAPASITWEPDVDGRRQGPPESACGLEPMGSTTWRSDR
jgi:hypothetical protein